MSSTEQERAVRKILFGVQETHSGLQRLKALGTNPVELAAAEEALAALQEKLRPVCGQEIG